jgi:hypothetical protein
MTFIIAELGLKGFAVQVSSAVSKQQLVERPVLPVI